MPSPTTPLSSLALVVLARLHASPTQRTRGKLTAALARFAPDREADAAWRDQIARALAELTSAGLLGPGLEVRDVAPLRAWLGEDLERPWSQLVDLVWPARALGLDADGRRRLRTRDDLAAAIAARALGLWTAGPPPSPAAFCDLLAWRELGLRGAPKRLPAEVRALFLQRLLHTTSGAPERLLRLLAARELATPRTELRALRDALVRRWISPPPAPPAPPAAPADLPASLAPAATPADSAELDARFLADLTQAAAHAAGFGPRKVFLSSLFDQLRRLAAWHELERSTFDTRLLAAHRRGEVQLARADLTGAMDQALVSSSTISVGGATFHFLVRGET